MIPPFYKNTAEGRCFQCSLRGALEAFKPEHPWSWEQLDNLTGKQPGLYTWFFKAAAELPALGYEVRIISDLDIQAFAVNAKAHIRAFYSPASAEAQITHTDIPAEEHVAQKVVDNTQNITIETRSFQEKDIKSLINQGFMVIPQINPYKLAGEEGYSGHFILIYGVEGEEAIYHDSGPGGAASSCRKPLAKIIEAALDNGKMEGLIAIRPQQK